jgi:hypothetical protein
LLSGADAREVRVLDNFSSGRREHLAQRPLGGLLVADLSDQYYVRVLAEEGAQRRREGEADLLLGRHLVDAGIWNSTGSSTVMML